MIGLDVVACSRIEKAIRHDSFLQRIFSEQEQAYIKKSPHSAETAAGLFAGKEAVAKALGTGLGKIRFRDIEIGHDSEGKPEAHLTQRAKARLAKAGACSVSLSISHDGGVAMAVAALIYRDFSDEWFGGEHLEDTNPTALFSSLSPDSLFAGCGRGWRFEPQEMNRETELYREEDLILSLLHRDRSGYKTQYGRIAIVGGSKGMVGSVCLAAQAALRTGAGLVYAVVPESIACMVQAKLLEAIIVAVPDDGTGHFTSCSLSAIEEAVKDCDAVAFGPGMGRCDALLSLLETLLTHLSVPCVLDADALNAIAKGPSLLDTLQQPILLTPHEMEMSRISGVPLSYIQTHRRLVAKEFAQAHGALVILKGADTIITDGNALYINHSGNPGMATAGSGDVLTGMVTALLGYGYPEKTAARLGCYMHGLAGDVARSFVGEESLIASDLIQALPQVFYFLRNAGTEQGGMGCKK